MLSVSCGWSRPESDTGEAGDEWPDDVCEVAVAETSSEFRAQAETDFGRVCVLPSDDDLMRRVEQAAARTGAARSAPFAPGKDRIYTLCRLLC